MSAETICDFEGKLGIKLFLKHNKLYKSRCLANVDLEQVKAFAEGREIRYINIFGSCYALIYRASNDFIGGFIEPWGCIVYMLSTEDIEDNVKLLKYIRERFEIMFFPPSSHEFTISMFRKAGYFNYGDPEGIGRTIMRSREHEGELGDPELDSYAENYGDPRKKITIRRKADFGREMSFDDLPDSFKNALLVSFGEISLAK